MKSFSILKRKSETQEWNARVKRKSETQEKFICYNNKWNNVLKQRIETLKVYHLFNSILDAILHLLDVCWKGWIVLSTNPKVLLDNIKR